MRLHNTCQICGYTGNVGVWHGETEQAVSICGQCTVNSVPALIADALDQPCYMGGLESKLDQIQIGFWKAMTARLLPGKSHPPAANGCDHN